MGRRSWKQSNLLALAVGVGFSLVSVGLVEGFCYHLNRTPWLKMLRPEAVFFKDQLSKKNSPDALAINNSFDQLKVLNDSFVPMDLERSEPIDRSREAMTRLWESSFVLKKNRRENEVITLSRTGQTVYDVWYQTDDNGRRATPQSDLDKRKKHLVLLGCSFVYGLGLDQGATLAARLADLAPRYNVYNHGLPGQSPAAFIKLAAEEKLWKGIQEKEGVSVFVFLDEHMKRVFGSMSSLALYGNSLPFVNQREDGFFEVQGSFESSRPGLVSFYSWLWRSEIVQAFNMDWPWRFSHSQYEDMARMLLQIKQSYLKAFPGQRFLVVGFPGAHSFQMRKLKASLARLGIEYGDYSDDHLEWYANAPLYIKYDGHPTAEAHRIWAPVLARDLDLMK